jgi:hypothetical protein
VGVLQGRRVLNAAQAEYMHRVLKKRQGKREGSEKDAHPKPRPDTRSSLCSIRVLHNRFLESLWYTQLAL